MAMLTGSSTAEIDAPLTQVWVMVEDVERAPEWQGGLKAMRALERDGEGRAVLCQTETDARVRMIKSTVRFTYDGPTTLTWRQDKGELRSMQGRCELQDLGGNRTRATYSLEVDLGGVLGLVIRGPLVDLLRGMLVSARAGELKRVVESGWDLGAESGACAAWSRGPDDDSPVRGTAGSRGPAVHGSRPMATGWTISQSDPERRGEPSGPGRWRLVAWIEEFIAVPAGTGRDMPVAGRKCPHDLLQRQVGEAASFRHVLHVASAVR